MLIYSQNVKFNVRDGIDIFNESVETLSIEILSKKSRNIVIAAVYRPPKGNNKLFKDFCKDFLNKQQFQQSSFPLKRFQFERLRL